MNVTLAVEEFQGLYGPYHVSELVLQKIWLKSAYDSSRLRDEQGREVKVAFPGRWNRIDGPDFKGAVLVIDGERVEGDVEIHFSRSDWNGHGHQLNQNFDRVVLHVVYHPVAAGEIVARTSSGEAIPTVSLMDLLWYDLEEYASEDSIIESTGAENEDAVDRLFELPVEQRRSVLTAKALERWAVKRSFAKLRVDQLGWSGACHTSVLEILGYSANRVPMLHIAGAYPWIEFIDRSPTIEQLWEIGRDYWTLSAVRPANHPKIRLEQYVKWVSEKRDWPRLLLNLKEELPSGGIGSVGGAKYRKSVRLREIQDLFLDGVTGGHLSGSKLDTVVCDGFLPLMSAYLDLDLSGLWFHWFAGNVPNSLVQSLKRLSVLDPRMFPMSNGWSQGLLKLRHSKAISEGVNPLG